MAACACVPATLLTLIPGLDRIGKASADAIEGIGKTALHAIDDRQEVQSHDSSLLDTSAHDVPTVSFLYFFENNEGQAHFEALGLLSSSHAAEASSLLRELPSEEVRCTPPRVHAPLLCIDVEFLFRKDQR